MGGLRGSWGVVVGVALLCLGTVTGNTAGASEQTPLSGYGFVGEAHNVDMEDSRLQEVTTFAVAELNKRTPAKGPRSLMGVVSAHKQIVKGTLYHIALRVEAAGAVPGKAVETYEVTVLDNPQSIMRIMRMQVTATQSLASLKAQEEARASDQAAQDAQEIVGEPVQEEIDEPMFLLDESVEASQQGAATEAPGASELASNNKNHEAPAASEPATTTTSTTTNHEAPAASEPANKETARAAPGRKPAKVSRLRKAAGGLATGGWRRRSEL